MCTVLLSYGDRGMRIRRGEILQFFNAQSTKLLERYLASSVVCLYKKSDDTGRNFVEIFRPFSKICTENSSFINF
jgi:hypothetical protein